MKRERPRHNDRFVPPVLPNGQSGIEPRRVFVFKGEGRLTADNGPAKTIQRILIFDNHPETLDLLFGREEGTCVDSDAEESTSWWEPVLAWILMTGVSILLLVTLFLKLRS